jgi:hypothetical protein
MRTTSPNGENTASSASGASTTPTRFRAVWAVGGAVGIGAILMGASVALATFQSRPQTDAAVVVSATSQSQNSAAPTAKPLPNAPIPQTGAPGPSSASTVQLAVLSDGSTVVIGGDQPTITLPPAPRPPAVSSSQDAAAVDVTVHAAAVVEETVAPTPAPSTEAPSQTATPTDPVTTDPGTPAPSDSGTPSQTAAATQTETVTPKPATRTTVVRPARTAPGALKPAPPPRPQPLQRIGGRVPHGSYASAR